MCYIRQKQFSTYQLRTLDFGEKNYLRMENHPEDAKVHAATVDDVPFSILVNLYNDLRAAKVAGKKRPRSSYASAHREARRSLLTNAWIRIAKHCGYGHDVLSKRTTDDTFVPAQLLPPSESFKLLSLMVPSLDSVHAYLGMKESKLADAFVRALDLTSNGADAQWLKHHKDKEYRPQRWKQDANIVDGNFATVLKAVLTDRCPSESSLTIGVVWDSLTALSKASRGRSSRIVKKPMLITEDVKNTGSVSDPWFGDASSYPEDAKAIALRRVVHLGTSDEVAEFARIILKDLDIRLTEDTFFHWFHPGAKQHYTQIHDIHRLLKDCSDPCFEVGEASVQVGKYASVMLTMRPSRKKLDVICENLRGVGDSTEIADNEYAEEGLGFPPSLNKKEEPYFIMEPKLDGERMQLHKWKPKSSERAPYEFQVRTFSRRGNDSSDMYVGALREVVLSAIQAQDIILDGEIMIWDELKSAWLRFEDIREVATSIAKKTVADGASYILKYMVFDVLYVDQGSKKGESRRGGNMVIRLPLHKRRCLLSKLVKPKELPYCVGARASIEIVDMDRGHNDKELANALQRFETMGYEGVIAKHPDKPYVLAERNLDISIKLKPDYFDGGIADLDVLILGGKYSASRGHRLQRAGRLSSFLIGVRADDTSTSGWRERGLQWEERMKKCKWVPIGSVGTGYSDTELAELQDMFDGKWKHFDKHDLPDHFEDKEYSQTLLDHVAKWIEPADSVVFTIRAFELNRRVGALRFPRVERINWEKPYFDVPTFEHVQDLDDNKQPALVRADENDADEVFTGSGEKKTRKMFDAEEERAMKRVKEEGHLVTGGRSAKSVIASAQGADISKIARICSAFSGMTFFVVAPDAAPKESLEIKIHQLGGSFVQNFMGNSDYIICTSANLARIKAMKQTFEQNQNSGTCSILRSNWIEECFSKKARIIPSLDDIIYATPELEAELFEEADRFGDAWEKDATVELLSRSLDEVEKWEKKRSSNGSLDKFKNADCRKVHAMMKKAGNIFMDMNVWVPREKKELKSCIPLIRGFGGKISEIENEDVTHILTCNEGDSKRSSSIQEHISVITKEWVWKAVRGARHAWQ